jgi:FKBP-type peptidyl-prolyl cis-trans isomerase
MRYWLFNILLVLILVSCGNNEQPKKKIPYQQLKESLIKKNKTFSQIENDQIEAYIKRYGLKNVVKTGTGLRYQVYQKGFGVSPKCGNIAEIEYTLSLLNGKELYKTKPGQTTLFLVCRDEVESGLHEAIQYLKVGDKAKIIIPSHLAHGIAGDFEKIPPRSTIVYDIHLVAVK